MDDLADVVVVDATTMGQMIEAGQAADITAVWEEYADELTKELIAPAGSTSFEMAHKDGKLYGIPYATPRARVPARPVPPRGLAREAGSA